MPIKIETIHFTADSKLLKYVNDRVSKLDQYFDQIVGYEVFLKLDTAHSQGNKISEIKVLLPGKDLFAKKQGNSFEETTDEVVEALRKQIVKHKEKIRNK